MSQAPPRCKGGRRGVKPQPCALDWTQPALALTQSQKLPSPGHHGMSGGRAPFPNQTGLPRPNFGLGDPGLGLGRPNLVWEDPAGLGRPGWFGKSRASWFGKTRCGKTRLVWEDPVGLERPGWFGETQPLRFGKARLVWKDPAVWFGKTRGLGRPVAVWENPV
eukprot:5634009-Pyramimonas_sp.AAC.1